MKADVRLLRRYRRKKGRLPGFGVDFGRVQQQIADGIARDDHAGGGAEHEVTRRLPILTRAAFKRRTECLRPQ